VSENSKRRAGRYEIVPDTQSQDHSSSECAAHRGEATARPEAVGVAESGLLGGAECVGDQAAGNTSNGGGRVLDDLLGSLVRQAARGTFNKM
jgi:hypothetical protein